MSPAPSIAVSRSGWLLPGPGSGRAAGAAQVPAADRVTTWWTVVVSATSSDTWPELLITGAFQDFLVDNGGNATGNIVASPHGVIANLTVTYDVAPRVQLFTNARNAAAGSLRQKDPRILPDMAVKVTFLEDTTAATGRSEAAAAN